MPATTQYVLFIELQQKACTCMNLLVIEAQHLNHCYNLISLRTGWALD
jgi:hypothetical protein